MTIDLYLVPQLELMLEMRSVHVNSTYYIKQWLYHYGKKIQELLTTHTHRHIYTHIHTYTHTHIHTYTHTHIHTNTHTHIHTYTQTHTHIHTHKHIYIFKYIDLCIILSIYLNASISIVTHQPTIFTSISTNVLVWDRPTSVCSITYDHIIVE